MPAPLLSFCDVTKRYRIGLRETTVLDRVNLEIHSGEFLTVVGPSGSGKSTFLNVAGCLDVPTTGRVFFEGVDVCSIGDDGRSRMRLARIGFVFQQFNLLPRASALDNVALPLVYARVDRRTRLDRAAEMLDRVGLADQRDQTPAQLSGGQQQRVAIARALVNGPSLILADEPTGALDSRTGAELIALLRALNDAGATVVVVTHDPAVAALGGRVVGFRDGRPVAPERDASLSLQSMNFPS